MDFLKKMAFYSACFFIPPYGLYELLKFSVYEVNNKNFAEIIKAVEQEMLSKDITAERKEMCEKALVELKRYLL